jgi:hypothetical protein
MNKRDFYVIAVLVLLSSQIYGQLQKGIVLSTETNSGIGFVSIGIIGKNIGTVADEKGNFTINIDPGFDNDSLKFSMIGYEPVTFSVKQFKVLPEKKIYLKPLVYNLKEVRISARASKMVTMGIQVKSSSLLSGFAYNNPGAELGINITVRKPVMLSDINFNVARCTFDSVTYRLNVYQLEGNGKYRNILVRPVYITFSKNKIKKAITFDLRNYSIRIEGVVLITMELYKSPGEGNLLFYTDPKEDFTWNRKASEGDWVKTPGEIGLYLHGKLLTE